MAESFSFELITPVKTLVAENVQEVTVPAYDGECGVLPGHENFVGLLGTGALKFVKNGDDFWYVVSSGIYQVRNGQLIILTELGEEAAQVKIEEARNRLVELDKEIASSEADPQAVEALLLERERCEARLEVYNRTHVVN